MDQWRIDSNLVSDPGRRERAICGLRLRASQRQHAFFRFQTDRVSLWSLCEVETNTIDQSPSKPTVIPGGMSHRI